MARPITGIASVILHTRLVPELTATTEKTKLNFLLVNWQRYVSLSRSLGRLWDTFRVTCYNKQKQVISVYKVIVGSKIVTV